MRAITLKYFGDVTGMQLMTAPKPTPGPQELLVRVHATSLNRADILQRRGKYPPPAGASEILGLEIAGEIEAFGKDVSGFQKGQHVFGLVPGGGYAEYAAIDAACALLIPNNLSYQEAAAIPEAFFTADEALFNLGELHSGQSLLIHGGGSGVATAVIQLAKQINAKVFVTASTKKKIQNAVKLGAVAGINYKQEDFDVALSKLTQQQGVDLIIDSIGATYFARNLNLLKNQGKLIQLAAHSGAKCEINLLTLITRRLQIKGLVMRHRSLAEKRELAKRFKDRWLPLFATGKLLPIVDCVFPLEKIAEAHLYMEDNKNFGKIGISI